MDIRKFLQVAIRRQIL